MKHKGHNWSQLPLHYDMAKILLQSLLQKRCYVSFFPYRPSCFIAKSCFSVFYIHHLIYIHTTQLFDNEQRFVQFRINTCEFRIDVLFFTISKEEKEDYNCEIQKTCGPNDAWDNKTIKEIILFGKDFEEARYAQTIDACQLTNDLKELPAGDSTELGENGINLSGGQKARIALARSVYADRDIMLLDDPISALDPKVAKKENCQKDCNEKK